MLKVPLLSSLGLAACEPGLSRDLAIPLTTLGIYADVSVRIRSRSVGSAPVCLYQGLSTCTAGGHAPKGQSIEMLQL